MKGRPLSETVKKTIKIFFAARILNSYFNIRDGAANFMLGPQHKFVLLRPCSKLTSIFGEIGRIHSRDLDLLLKMVILN